MLTDRDRALHKGLMKLLDEGTFTLKAREIAAFAEVYKWAHELLIKIEPPKKSKPQGKNK